MAVLKCPYCGRTAELRDSKIIYGRSYGLVYICPGYPECDSYVGVHNGSATPLGTMANPELRHWRKEAHAVFDRVWKESRMRRSKAYKWLRNQLRLSKDECHIAMFDVEQCKKVVELAKKKLEERGGRNAKKEKS